MLIPRRFLLARLKTDVSRQTIAWIRLFVLLSICAVAFWAYVYRLNAEQKKALADWRLLVVFIAVPVLVGLLRGLVSSQVSSKAATAVDEFDDLTTLALGGCARPLEKATGARKIVVFVDDLDRVTAKVARDVLDNLRTFFDKAQLSFVVTGDHTVLEASLGRELMPSNDGSPEQLEQGRLFLKKVFNVYWRLPLPVRADFESFVDAEMKKRKPELDLLIASEADSGRLRDWLLGYCDTNLRQVIRTLDGILFTLLLVGAQLESASSDEKPALEQMVEKPMLLVRVLFIQDCCAPLFELLVGAPSLLFELDRRVFRAKSASGGPDAVAEFRDYLKSTGGKQLEMGERHSAFLTRFAYEEPLFWDSGGQVVNSLDPWIHLASDLSFGDASGPLPEDFVRDLANNNREGLTAAIDRCSEARARAATDAAATALAQDENTAQRARQLSLWLEVSSDADADRPLAREAVQKIAESLESLLEGVEDSLRPPLLDKVASALDRQGAESFPAPSAFALRSVADFDYLPRHEYGPLGSRFVIDWIATYYTQNPPDCLRFVEEFLPLLATSHVTSEMANLSQSLAGDLASDSDDSRRDIRLRMLLEHAEDGESLARDSMLGLLNHQDAWSWCDRAAGESRAPWNANELRSLLITWIAEAPDENELLERIQYAADKMGLRSADMWRRLADDRFAELMTHLTQLRNEALSSLEMPEDVATRLYRSRTREVDDAEEEALAVNLAQDLNPNAWLWRRVDRKVARKGLRFLADRRARRKQLQSVVKPFYDSL